MSQPKSMRAIVFPGPGGPELLQPGDIPVPELIPGHALLRVYATSVNPVDVKIRQGLPIAPETPAVLHGDVAGVIEAIAPDVRESHPEGLRAGDAVYGCCGGVRGSGGALAEYMLVDARLLAKTPPELSFAEAAALPLVTITAWEALFDRAGLPEPAALSASQPEPAPTGGPDRFATSDASGARHADPSRPPQKNPHGESILIQGGAGGVGHVAVQLAKASVGPETRVYATASSGVKQRLVESLGATPIPYREETVEEYVANRTDGAGFALVFDTVGGASLDASFAAVARGGQVCAIATRSTHDLSPLHTKGASLHVIFMLQPLLFNAGRARHGEILRMAAKLVTAKKLRPLIDERRFPFSRAAEAHSHYESGRATGKIVLENDLGSRKT
ncbi:MAG: zinc-dependent alcohol dehydrogenase family protein [Leptospirales bacterium]|jgi:NADPH2:quinone reductase